MKFTLAIALLVLVISHGTESASLVKRDVPAEIQKITKFLEDISSMFTTTVTELVEKIKATDLTSENEAYLQEGKAQVQPLLQPLAASVEAQVEDLLRKAMDLTKALLTPQIDPKTPGLNSTVRAMHLFLSVYKPVIKHYLFFHETQVVTMKFALTLIFVLLAVSQGTESKSLVKREAEIEKITKFFEDLGTTITSTAEDVVEKVKSHELTQKAEAAFEEAKTQLQTFQEELAPITTNMQDQIQSLASSVEDILQKLADRTKSLAESAESQLSSLAESAEAQIRPLAESAKAEIQKLKKSVEDQVRPLLDSVDSAQVELEAIVQKVKDQASALL
ncbi:uncharacterized protein LOC134083372 [Sardina pilchardus]|uniref:uncharacterized protein LOC134083372 n=1 Tax=Sardina pilchardus TaxID=27697 RepID=UPI002E153719